MSISIHINRVHYPITSLGFGSRLGIWLQGCSIQCPGCVSRDTWNPSLGRLDLSDLILAIEPWARTADGLTVSGGEPFDQPESLAALLSWWRQSYSGDILVFSGYPSELLKARHPEIVAAIDVLISDPYDAHESQQLPLRGSDNQRLHLLTPLACERYGTIDQAPKLDVCFEGQTVWIAGIPKSQHLQLIRSQLQELGITAQTSNQIVGGVRA